MKYDHEAGEKIFALLRKHYPREMAKAEKEVAEEMAREKERLAAKLKKKLTQPLAACAGARDGDCSDPRCPQLRDGEPAKTGRHCPLDIIDPMEM